MYYLFYFDIAFTHFVEKMGIQNTENSETKQEITKRVLSIDKTKLEDDLLPP